MKQKIWEDKLHNKKEGQSGDRRTWWPGILLDPAMVLGALALVIALSLSLCHAFEGRGRREGNPGPVVVADSQDHRPAGNQVPGRLGGDDEDDNEEEGST